MDITFEDTGNNVYVDDRRTDGHANNVGDVHTYAHEDSCTWSEVVSRDTIRGSNVQPLW